MASEKHQEAALADHEIIGDKVDKVDQVETAQIARLTEDEEWLEKKLVRKIDWLIMPTILSVYLMNWIDRYTSIVVSDQN